MGSSLPTVLGSVISILMTISLAFFGFYKIMFVVQRKGWTMVSTIKEHRYTSDDVFGADQGMAIAIALWQPIDPKIGTLEIVSDEWGNDEDGKDFWRVTPIEYHICTLEELGLGNGKG